MREFAANLEFEKAAALRDELIELRKQIGGNEGVLFGGKARRSSIARCRNSSAADVGPAAGSRRYPRRDAYLDSICRKPSANC